MPENVIDVLQKRGFIDNLTSSEIESLCQKPIKLYIGFDPTADSLHLGSLVGIIAMAWFQKYGHEPVALLGGATGLIGDPSGKSLERPYLDTQTLEKNIQGIAKNLNDILNRDHHGSVSIVNNYDWYQKMDFLSFLRQVGSHFRLSPLLSRDTVKTRLSTQEGMSFKEFTYPLLQAYDFYRLFEDQSIMLQIGGADQWTNITSGIELIRKKTQKEAYGLTFPLLVKSDGKKFGKTESGTIWLSKEKCSAYDFYKYLYRVADDDVISLLKRLTFLPMSEIKQIEKNIPTEPNAAQKILASEVTRIVHGEKELKVALEVTEQMRPGSDAHLSLQELKLLSEKVPHVILQREAVLEKKLIDVICEAQILTSKGEARRLIQNGGLYLNNERITDTAKTLTSNDLIEEQCLLLALGKKRKVVIFFEN